MVRDLKIEPIIDLMHYGTPLWLMGSFADPTYPERVAAYSRVFAERYGKLVRFYTPLNEPTINASLCGSIGAWPPYLTGDRGYLTVMLAIARGIQLSSEAIRTADPDAVLVAVEAMNWFQAGHHQAERAVQHLLQHNLLGWDLVSGCVDAQHPLYGWLLDNGASEEALAVLRERPVRYDILGVNFYPWSAREIEIDEAGVVRERILPSNGYLLANVLRRCYKHARIPLFVTETSTKEDVEGRATWMDETIAAVNQVRSEGIPVIGYTWFPLITMIDWIYRHETGPVSDYLINLGLWDSTFDEQGILVRHETSLVEKYRGFIAK